MKHSGVAVFLLATRPRFLVASAAPVLVGSALGYVAAGSFQMDLFVLALLAIMALHAGANIINDYFDHVSGNDWINENPTPFSGGRRYIQNHILSPRTTLRVGLLWLGIGSVLGAVLVLLTESIFILCLGLVGLLGGFFYTARPIQLGYRCVGEFVIGLLFGLLPVYGAYYLQSESIDAFVLLPGLIVSILIFLVILVNEFPDVSADAAVNKRTLIVLFGVSAGVWIYKIALMASYAVAAAMLLHRSMFIAGLLYLFTMPIAIIAAKSVNTHDLVKPGQYRASWNTVLLHTIGSLALAVGLVSFGLLFSTN